MLKNELSNSLLRISAVDLTQSPTQHIFSTLSKATIAIAAGVAIQSKHSSGRANARTSHVQSFIPFAKSSPSRGNFFDISALLRAVEFLPALCRARTGD
jgi:hypothetical protein